MHTPTKEAINFTPQGLTVYAVFKEMGENKCVELDAKLNPAIFTAVNAHEDLVKAGKEALRFLEERADLTSDWTQEVFAKLEEALAKAGVK